MASQIIIFEDKTVENFFPLTCLRPVYFLHSGIKFIYRKVLDCFADYEPVLFCRPELKELTAELADLPVNRLSSAEGPETIFINGRVVDPWAVLKKLDDLEGGAVCLVSGDDIIAVRFTGAVADEEIEMLNRVGTGQFLIDKVAEIERHEVDIKLYNFLWDFVNDIDRAIPSDIEFMKNNKEGLFGGPEWDEAFARKYPGAHFINEKEIYLAHDVEIAPSAVLDASRGPIYIEDMAEIQPHTYLIGPAYIGRETLLVGGKIEGCSIGPVCRAGGEVEETIIQGYTNKYHAGFLGHAYVGEWVNFGAMTTNSDLKNDYSNVKVTVNGQLIDTGSIKVGSFIGDFTKTAIGTLLNTGINIGVNCNLVGKGIITDKEIPNFTWLLGENKHPYKLSKALDVIEKSMGRRKMALSQPLKQLLTELHGKR